MTDKTLEQVIINRIGESKEKKMSFHDFMEIALYHESLGYYSKPTMKIGKQGDFYTNSSVNNVFGHVLADQIAEMSGMMDAQPAVLIEFGGGTGALASHILDRLSSYSHIYSDVTLFMIEKSTYHQQLQREALSRHKGKVIWVEELGQISAITKSNDAVIYSNELVDAFPVHRIRYVDGKWEEQYVVIDQDSERLKLEFHTDIDPCVMRYILEKDITLAENQEAEINLASAGWMREVAEWLHTGFVITIDYGYEREELYAPYRMEGTFMCYYQHRNDVSPTVNIGSQDMTSHIDFTTLIETGEMKGLSKVIYLPQQQFLINGGILSFLTDAFGEDPFSSPNVKRNRAIRQLIQPGGMGDAFSVLVQQKGYDGVTLRCSRNPFGD